VSSSTECGGGGCLAAGYADLAVSPGLILVGNNIVLEVAYSLAFGEGGVFALGVKQFRGRFVLKDFVRAFGEVTDYQLACDLPQIDQDVEPGLLPQRFG